ncbi:FAD synthase [Selaginella moellendorffii]|nr:FAD synthase [Selaginella moellendorffii]|eukprot:XP_002976522.2 FAD synthase [Selaginella moellendorffii]
MEICRAVDASCDRRLQAKYKHAMFVIDRTLALYRPDEVAFSFNGGKDSTVLLHLLRAGYAALKSKLSLPADAEDRIRTIYFEGPDAFPEIDSFTYETAQEYNLELEVLRQDFKSGLEALLKNKPIKAIFLGTRIGDPNAVGQEQFSPSSTGWPPFMRVNPILDWSYRDVWAFLLACKVPYCKLYDQGYTSIGSVHDTVPNEALYIDSSVEEDCPELGLSRKKAYKPAYLLRDGRLERAGRLRKQPRKDYQGPGVANGVENTDTQANVDTLYAASVLSVGDELLRGDMDDQMGTFLSKELFSLGWTVTRRAVVPNDVDAVAEEIEQRSSASDIVLVCGGVGPLHCDVTLAGVAKAFGVRLAPDEEFEEYLRQLVGDNCAGDQNAMARLPEGITELLHHKRLSIPVIKCRNVFVLSGPTIRDFKLQYQCLLELSKSRDFLATQHPFCLIRLETQLSKVEIAKPFSQLAAEYPDLTLGCYHQQDDKGAPVINIMGKNPVRVKAAACALRALAPKQAFPA